MPAGGFEEESDAGLFAVVLDVDGMDAAQVVGVDDDSDFLVASREDGVHDGFVGFGFAGGGVPPASAVAAPSLGEQDVAVAHEQQVYVQDHMLRWLTHVVPLRPTRMTLAETTGAGAAGRVRLAAPGWV